jgi:hypothetical protein
MLASPSLPRRSRDPQRPVVLRPRMSRAEIERVPGVRTAASTYTEPRAIKRALASVLSSSASSQLDEGNMDMVSSVSIAVHKMEVSTGGSPQRV